MTKIETFRELNQSNEILHIGNVWDVQSALIFEKQNYKALGTSSYAISKSLGLEDGENLSFEELYKVVKLIISKTDMILSVDIEAGYSRNIEKIVENIVSLHEIGVVGINIEDSIVIDNTRQIMTKEEFSIILKEIKKSLHEKNIDIFINARTDYFIMGLDNALEETIKRIKLYEQSDADGIFVPCVVDIKDIETLVNSTNLPLNIMSMPNLPSFEILQEVGVKRLSQGPFVYNSLISDFEKKLENIKKDSAFIGLFDESN